MNVFNAAVRPSRLLCLAGLALVTLACDGEGDVLNADFDPEAVPGDDGEGANTDLMDELPMPGEEGGEMPEPETPDPEQPEEPGPQLETCAAVDVLFVVDNSDTMAEEQGKLLASAGGFIGDAAAILPVDTSFHVGVITTDSPDLVRAGPEGACNFAVDDVGYATHSGALDVELASALSCAANVGVEGNPDERPMEMALRALGPEAGLPEAPNAGFLRDDAVLVVVVLTDEEDDFEAVTSWGSAGDPEDWANELSDIVYGVDERVVVLGLVGSEKPNACPEFQWDGVDGAEIAPRLMEFTTSFEHGLVADVCATSYSDFFSAAALEVSAACG